MNQKAEIQVQDQFGSWHFFMTVPSTGTQVQHALKAALKTPLGKKSNKSRAVDPNSGVIIDFLQG
jgi:hypothetical protein